MTLVYYAVILEFVNWWPIGESENRRRGWCELEDVQCDLRSLQLWICHR